MFKAGTLEPAYILHARNYRDTSLILDLFTRDAGRYSVVSRGARSPKSKFRGRLQPFTPLLIASVGRSELKTSTTIDFPKKPVRLLGQDLMLGLYVNELLYRLLDRFYPVSGLYDDYEQLLSDLQKSQGAKSGSLVAIRRFELCLLQELGYGINFEYDARNGQPVQRDASYRFVVHEGFHSIEVPGQDVFTGEEVLNLAAGDLCSVDPKRLLGLTRLSLAELLGDKPLKSRSLFKGGHG